MFPSLPRLLAILLWPLLVLSCTQDIPDSQFDARKTPVAARDLTFKNINIRRTPDRSLLKAPDETYILGPGDILEIEIAEVPGTLARTFVMPDGMVYYNLAGGVHAEGLTQAQFGKKLEEALSKDYTRPLVNVSLVEVHSRRFWILGRVFKPGLYPLRQPTTLLEAVSQAGGLFTSRFSGTTEELADLSKSVVIRDGDILPVDFEKLIRNGDTSHNIYLRHNDYIYLPSATTSTVLVLGAVAAPQAVPHKDSLTLIDCIAQSKGPAKDAHLTEVVIVRGSLDKPAASVVNLKAILTGKETNVLLQPGDIVWIPRRPLGLLETTVKLIFQDAARTVAVGEGARAAGGNQDPVITIPVTSP
ncbi:MAG: polysaccharide export protein [Akkermansiaceae bacterium]|jgi:protein involved in polysaccharide export with SLBB domain|nr:polysaccharide export protein [Akkermansiaceae bacterium]